MSAAVFAAPNEAKRLGAIHIQPFGLRVGTLLHNFVALLYDFGKLLYDFAAFLRKDASFLRKDASFLRKDASFLRKDAPFLRKDAPFLRKDVPAACISGGLIDYIGRRTSNIEDRGL
ncbi:MAG: hypothetical protein LBF90_04600 [Prevotellaceae bacterium]|nr:hypothetical protein [Prevotellaceae bacterium]